MEAPGTFEARVLPSRAELAEAAAREFAEAAREAMRERGVFRVALSGGSTPRDVHGRLASAPYRRRVAWDRVRFFFGDERCVAPGSDRSNYRMARETLFAPLAIDPASVFRMRGELQPKAAADAYSRILAANFGDDQARGIPVLDLVFLGVGPDGHTASLFPGTRALEEKKRTAAANWVPGKREWRLTLTYPVFAAARRVVFLVAGAEKAPVAATILKKRPGWRDLPASRIRPARGTVLWLLDEDAGGSL